MIEVVFMKSTHPCDPAPHPRPLSPGQTPGERGERSLQGRLWLGSHPVASLLRKPPFHKGNWRGKSHITPLRFVTCSSYRSLQSFGRPASRTSSFFWSLPYCPMK